MSRAFGRCARWNACEGLTSNVMREKKVLPNGISSQHSCWKLFAELTTRSAEVAGRDVEIAPSPVDLA